MMRWLSVLNIYNLDIVMMIWLITLTIYIYLYRKNFMIIIEHYKNFIRCVNVSHLLIQYFLLGTHNEQSLNIKLPQSCGTNKGVIWKNKNNFPNPELSNWKK